MAVEKGSPFEKCPLCHSSRLSRQTRRSSFWRSIRASRCSTCGAIFVSSGRDRYRLSSCDPARLGLARGKKAPWSGCGDCPPPPDCLLGKSLSRSDWDRLGQGQPIEAEGVTIEKRAKMKAGDLSELPAEQSPVTIEQGEKLHHVATVYTCEQPLPEGTEDEARLVVTSRRLVLLYQGTSLEIRLETIDRLETAFPGFLVYTKGARQPYCFFPRRGDPVLDAVEGALLNARRQ